MRRQLAFAAETVVANTRRRVKNDSPVRARFQAGCLSQSGSLSTSGTILLVELGEMSHESGSFRYEPTAAGHRHGCRPRRPDRDGRARAGSRLEFAVHGAALSE